MKKLLNILAVAALVTTASAAFGQASVSKEGEVGVHMARPINLDYYQQTEDNGYLDFGTLVQTIPHGGPGQSYATVHPWATAYGPGDLNNFTQLNAAIDPPQSSQWTATGEPNTAFTITIPNTNLFLENPLVTGINVSAGSWNWAKLGGGASGGPGSTTGPTVAFDGAGSFDFAIGGTLTCNQDGPINVDLTASFDVSVNY